MTQVVRTYTVTLILTLIALLAMGGCTYRIYNPNCNLRAGDNYKIFVDKFENCADDGVCGGFNHGEIPEGDSILLESNGFDTSVTLKCGGREAKTKFFAGVGLCSSEGLSRSDPLPELEIKKFMTSTYSENNVIGLQQIENDKVCIARIVRNVFPPASGA
tara:strand:+ start:710 stop:1189 length:480 start_codon:yes stop_codon:yes gene_type:complete